MCLADKARWATWLLKLFFFVCLLMSEILKKNFILNLSVWISIFPKTQDLVKSSPCIKINYTSSTKNWLDAYYLLIIMIKSLLFGSLRDCS